jgi:tRNA pseudouridine13 synthase
LREKLQSLFTHSKINDVYFKKDKDNFIVTEVPLYEFSGEGEHLIIKLSKKDFTTWKALQIISEQTSIKVKEFGYAGLKDKDGFTIQYISVHKSYEKQIQSFEFDGIKLQIITYHNNKIKTGHLKGNNFFIRLKKVFPNNAQKLSQVLELISKYGMPNYFGYQRFGNEGDNYIIGQQILQGKRKERDKKKRNFFISAYQSHLFNLWLSKRIEFSKMIEAFSEQDLLQNTSLDKQTIKSLKSQIHPFKVLLGDMLHHYPYGKVFECENLEDEVQRFTKKQICPTGLLPGKKTKLATSQAFKMENEVYSQSLDDFQAVNGTRRFAIVFPENITYKYIEQERHFEFNFYLPKGSYATVLLDELIS